MDPRVAQACIPAAATIIKSVVTHRQSMKTVERKAQLDKDLIEKKAQAQPLIPEHQTSHSTTTRQPQTVEPAEDQHGFEQNLDIVRSEPQCQYCNQLLELLLDEDGHTKRKGVAELAEMKKLMMRDPTDEQLQAKMQQFEVLPELTLKL